MLHACVQVAELNSKVSEIETGINRQQYEASEVKVAITNITLRTKLYSYLLVIQ